jgi:hypothetical protein
MKEILFELMDHNTKGVDTYYNNGSMWLIFTDEEKWVLELTKDGTLWYNFYFFQGCFKYLSLDVVENQHYITEWVEDTIQNGVKHTSFELREQRSLVEDTIQNGVINTRLRLIGRQGEVEDTIQNGVINTHHRGFWGNLEVEDAIQNGVKHTEYGDWLDGDERLHEIIENGIKKTHVRRVDNHPSFMDRIIETKHHI